MKKRVVIITLSLTLVLMLGMSVSAANGQTIEEWRDYYSTCGLNEIGVHMFADASLKAPLTPEYLQVDMNIDKLVDLPGDAWIGMAFVETSDYAMSPGNSDPKGLLFMLKNRGGTLNLSCYATGFGKAYFENLQLPANAIGDLKFELIRDEANSSWNLYLNGTKLNPDATIFADLETADFTDADGKTYLAFAAYDGTGDAPNARSWTIRKVTDVDPNAPTVTIAPTATIAPTDVPAGSKDDSENPQTSDPSFMGLVGISLLSSAAFVFLKRK